MSKGLKILAAGMLAVFALSAPASATELYTWGNGAPSPQVVELREPVAQLDASNRKDFALTTGGRVYSWEYKQTRFSTPKKVALPEPMVTTGEARDSGMAINERDEGFVWGENANAHLCTEGSTKTPVHPPALTGVVAVQGGETHTMWLNENGTIESCGSNKQGSLGLGRSIGETATPISIPGLEDVVEMSAGEHQELARTAAGEVYGWGGNNWGQACTGSTGKVVWTPQKVPLPEAAKQISAGGDQPGNGSTLIVLQDGQVYGCGDNQRGQAAPANPAEKLLSPTSTELTFAQAVTGGETSYGVTKSGELLAWGSTAYGDIGNGTTGPGEVRTPVTVLKRVESVSATARTVEALRK